MDDSKYLLLDNRVVLRIGGEDARDFLQGLVSNDLTKVSPTNTIYAALLTPQGKYLHDFFIAELDGAFLLDCERSRIDDLFKRLRMYKLRSKIELAIDDEFCVIALTGDQISEKLSLEPTKGATGTFLSGIAFIDPRLAEMGARAIMPSQSAEDNLSAEGCAPGDAADYDQRRLALGLPDGSRDMEIEKSILLECGFEELNGVSFEKGCYAGQELTARTKHRGLVKKRLMPVKIDGPTPEPGTEITLNGKNAGEMRSARDGMGLALIRLEILEGSPTLTAGSATLHPVPPKWAEF